MQQGITELTMRVGGSTYEVRIFVPSGISAAVLVPTVLVFHGGGGSGTGFAEEDGFEDLAEAQGFVVVHPSAEPAWPNWTIEDADCPGRADVAFTEQLIDTLTTDWRADPSRTYAVGWSIGGTFCARLAREIPERLAGVGAAGQFAVAPQLGDPPLPMPLIQINGTADPVIPFHGNGETIVTGPPDSWLWMLETDIPEAFHAGAVRRGCTSSPMVFNVGDDVVGYRYSGRDGGVEMLRYEIIGGGHVWPGGLPSRSEMGSTTSNLPGATAMWEFLRAYSR